MLGLSSQYFFTISQGSCLALCFVALEIMLCTSCKQKAPEIEWQKSYGGSLKEQPSCIIQTYDGGYAVAGYAESFDGDVIGNHGFCDYWILKIDGNGKIEWSKTYGGTYFETAHSIQQTPDHGFIIGGQTYSFDGDVMNNHGACDWWILKIDSTGTLQWQQTMGGALRDFCGQVQLTGDGGYIAFGTTGFNRDSIEGAVIPQDILVVKLKSTGSEEWRETFGGSRRDVASSIVQTTDGGFVLALNSESDDGDFDRNHSDQNDIWLIKLDRNGKLRWKKNFGGSGEDALGSLSVTQDGGYVIAGYSSSKDGDVKENHGFEDFLLVKFDSNGNLQWQKNYGGILSDWGGTIQQTADGGYIVSGTTSSIGNDVEMNNGLYDCWIIKLNEKGNLQWQKSLGGSGNDNATFIQQAKDGGYVVAGLSDSRDIDVTGNHGNTDFWIVKLKPE